MPPPSIVAPAFSPDNAGRRGAVDRGDYLIDRFRVRYEFGGGWKCGCAEFAASDACKHTREAAGRRAAQARILQHVTRGSSERFVFNEPRQRESLRPAGGAGGRARFDVIS
jgi:hypothetical protein